ncbi:hypothetical protein OPAG_05284 [Rhodococcus opacus PD630]|nr:hypothetical protein OPAG_05284 [Rhodococcus opacus PD630]
MGIAEVVVPMIASGRADDGVRSCPDRPSLQLFGLRLREEGRGSPGERRPR